MTAEGQLQERVRELEAELTERTRLAAENERQLERYAADLRETFKEERSRAQELRRSYMLTVRALASAVERGVVPPELRVSLEAMLEKFHNHEVTVQRSANEQGVLFGGVSQHDIAEELRQAGFDAASDFSPDAYQHMAEGAPGLYMFGHGASLKDPYAALELYHSRYSASVGTTAGNNRFSRYKNPEYDKLLDEMAPLSAEDPKFKENAVKALEIY
ncbi:MAG: hypothetical protein KY463_10645, partial [Actinobacteria bacterium]|nr:hypothetical protein [Actinomycetota bacterium]